MRIALVLTALSLLAGCAGVKEIRANCACLEQPINPPGEAPAMML